MQVGLLGELHGGRARRSSPGSSGIGSMRFVRRQDHGSGVRDRLQSGRRALVTWLCSAAGQLAQARDQDQVAAVLDRPQGLCGGRAARLVFAAGCQQFRVRPAGLVAGERGARGQGGLDVRGGVLRASLTGQAGSQPGRCPGGEEGVPLRGTKRAPERRLRTVRLPGGVPGDAEAAQRSSGACRVPDAGGDGQRLLRRLSRLAGPASERKRLAAAPQALAVDGPLAARFRPGECFVDLRQAGAGFSPEREDVAEGGARAPQPEHLGRHDGQVGQVAKLGDGFPQPPAHVAGHGLPVEQPGAAVGVACLLQQPAGAPETALCPGEVPGRQVDDRAAARAWPRASGPPPASAMASSTSSSPRATLADLASRMASSARTRERPAASSEFSSAPSRSARASAIMPRRRCTPARVSSSSARAGAGGSRDSPASASRIASSSESRSSWRAAAAA